MLCGGIPWFLASLSLPSYPHPYKRRNSNHLAHIYTHNVSPEPDTSKISNPNTTSSSGTVVQNMNTGFTAIKQEEGVKGAEVLVLDETERTDTRAAAQPALEVVSLDDLEMYVHDLYNMESNADERKYLRELCRVIEELNEVMEGQKPGRPALSLRRFLKKGRSKSEIIRCMRMFFEL